MSSQSCRVADYCVWSLHWLTVNHVYHGTTNLSSEFSINSVAENCRNFPTKHYGAGLITTPDLCAVGLSYVFPFVTSFKKLYYAHSRWPDPLDFSLVQYFRPILLSETLLAFSVVKSFKLWLLQNGLMLCETSQITLLVTTRRLCPALSNLAGWRN